MKKVNTMGKDPCGWSKAVGQGRDAQDLVLVLWPEKALGAVTPTISAFTADSLPQTVIDDPLSGFQLSNNMTASTTITGKED